MMPRRRSAMVRRRRLAIHGHNEALLLKASVLKLCVFTLNILQQFLAAYMFAQQRGEDSDGVGNAFFPPGLWYAYIWYVACWYYMMILTERMKGRLMAIIIYNMYTKYFCYTPMLVLTIYYHHEFLGRAFCKIATFDFESIIKFLAKAAQPPALFWCVSTSALVMLCILNAHLWWKLTMAWRMMI